MPIMDVADGTQALAANITLTWVRSCVLELARGPQQRRQDHRGQANDETDDPAGYVLAYQHRTQSHGDPDDSAGGDQAHKAAFDLRTAPGTSRQHPLGAVLPPRLALAPALLTCTRCWLSLAR
jgi:hypothetical protein